MQFTTNNLVALTVLFFAATGIPRPASSQDSSSHEAEDRIIELTNEFRESNGLKELSVNAALRQAASDFASFMLKEDKYGHKADGRRPSERAEIAGYDYCVVRENIAYRVDPNRPETSSVANDFFVGWKESEGHRENMLGEHITETGVAVASKDGITFYAVQMFGRPESAKFKIEIENQTDANQVVQFRTDGSRDDISLPPSTVVSLSRCIPFSISLESGGERLNVNESGRFAITQMTGGAIELNQL